MAAVNIRKEQFHEMTRGEMPVLVDFWAPWCGACRRIDHVYDRIAEEYQGRLTAVKVNIDEEAQLAQEQQIGVIPTLVLYRGGSAVDSVVAPDSKAAMDRFVRDALTR